MSRRSHKNKKYSKELRIEAVEAYQRGEGSQREICQKFGILDKRQLHNWIKPKFTVGAILGALSLICLNIGSNISFGTISAGMANVTPNFDAITVINSAADIPSVLFGGMPLEVIISGTCSAPCPWVAGIAMMVLSGILLLSGVMVRVAKYVPAQSIAGFLFVIGFSATLVPNLSSVASSATPLEGVVAASVTMISKNAFLGIVAGIIVKITGSLLGVV